MAQEKLRAREQWGQDPCGAEYDREHELGTLEFFDSVEPPLVKVYSRRQARELFSCFRDVKIEIEQLIRGELRFLAPLVSESMLDRLRQRFGWNVIITAIK